MLGVRLGDALRIVELMDRELMDRDGDPRYECAARACLLALPHRAEAVDTLRGLIT